MPCHTFVNEETGQTADVYVPINAPAAEHQSQTIDGKVYKRVYAAPLAAKDTKPGDATKEDFRRVTDKKGLKVKDLWNISSEMSKQRAEREGKDPVMEKMYADYEKESGQKHPDVERREKIESTHKKLEKWGVKIQL